MKNISSFKKIRFLGKLKQETNLILNLVYNMLCTRLWTDAGGTNGNLLLYALHWFLRSFLFTNFCQSPKVTLIHIVICKTNNSTLVMKIVPNAHRQTSSLTLNSQSVRRVKFLSTKHWNAFVLSSSSSGKAAYTLTASTSSTRDDKDCGSLDTECTKLEVMQQKQAGNIKKRDYLAISAQGRY